MPAAARVAEIASAIPTGNAARLALGASLTQLSNAYASVAAYNPSGLPTTGLVSDDVTAQGTEYLDGIRTRAESDFAALPATDDLLPPAQANQAAFDIASIETATGQMATLGTAFGDLKATAADMVNAAVPGWGTGIGLVLIIAGVVLLFIYVNKRA
jgi:hypothetical protein